MLESVYRRLLEARRYDVANFTGLAEVLYRRGRADEGDATLRRLVARDPDSASNFIAGAEAAASAGRLSVAIELREGAARIARADASNMLELARLRAAAGRGGEAATAYAALLNDDKAPNSVRARAIDLSAELVAKEPSLRSTLVGSSTSEPAGILSAVVGASSGDVASSRATLSPLVDAGSVLAALELGRIEASANQPSQAVAAFEKALAADPNGTLTSTVAFGGLTPIDALLQLYPSVGRPEAALALGTAHSETYDRDDAETSQGLAFEPDVATVTSAGSLESLSSRNASAFEREREASLAALADAAARLGRLDEAVAYARGRVTVAADADRPKAESRLDELLTAQRDAARRTATLLRVGQAVATDTIPVRDFSIE